MPEVWSPWGHNWGFYLNDFNFVTILALGCDCCDAVASPLLSSYINFSVVKTKILCCVYNGMRSAVCCWVKRKNGIILTKKVQKKTLLPVTYSSYINTLERCQKFQNSLLMCSAVFPPVQVCFLVSLTYCKEECSFLSTWQKYSLIELKGGLWIHRSMPTSFKKKKKKIYGYSTELQTYFYFRYCAASTQSDILLPMGCVPVCVLCAQTQSNPSVAGLSPALGASSGCCVSSPVFLANTVKALVCTGPCQ